MNRMLARYHIYFERAWKILNKTNGNWIKKRGGGKKKKKTKLGETERW